MCTGRHDQIDAMHDDEMRGGATWPAGSGATSIAGAEALGLEGADAAAVALGGAGTAALQNMGAVSTTNSMALVAATAAADGDSTAAVLEFVGRSALPDGLGMLLIIVLWRSWLLNWANGRR